MDNVVKGLIGLAVATFVIASLSSLAGERFMNTSPEAFSRASNNLSLIAIALWLVFKPSAKDGNSS